MVSDSEFDAWSTGQICEWYMNNFRADIGCVGHNLWLLGSNI